jgi:adenylate cyclase
MAMKASSINSSQFSVQTSKATVASWVMTKKRPSAHYDESLEVSKQALHLNPDDLYAHLSLAITYGLLDREVEAREAAAEVLRIDPDFSIEYFAKTSPITDPADKKRLTSAFRKAGLM